MGIIFNSSLLKIKSKRILGIAIGYFIWVVAMVALVLLGAYMLDGFVKISVSKIAEVIGILMVVLGVATVIEKRKFGFINIATGCIVFLVGFNVLAGTTQSLTKDERLEDFEYLYDVIAENHPYLTSNERVNGVVWLEKKEEFADNVVNATANESNNLEDLAFAAEISKVLRELNDNKTHVVNTGFLYSHRVYTSPEYENNFKLWDDITKGQEVLTWYGFDELEEGQVPPRPYAEIGDAFLNPHNYRLNIRSCRPDIIIPGEVAYLRVHDMNPLRVEEDGEIIREFFQEVQDYNKLIIDIRHNRGGDDRYWRENIIAPLITEETSVDNYFFVRGDYSKQFYHSRGIELCPISDLDQETLSSFPEEIITDFGYYGIHNVTIQPINPIDFKGEIYLLTDDLVNESAERFASFSKDSGFATLVGATTAGNATIFEPPIFSLPNSGMIIRYRGELAFNGDGNISGEVGITPHYQLEDTSISAPVYSEDKGIQYILHELE